MTALDCINEYVGKIDFRTPIFTQDIFEYIERKMPNVKRNSINEYVARYIKSNTNFVRYQKGIYYKTIATPFGSAGINYTELVKRAYITDGEEVFGYESGASFMNKIGLTTQMPACTCIVTNRHRTSIGDGGAQLMLTKPATHITKKNYRYLQFLDLLDNRMNVNIETENCQEILRDYIDHYGLNFELLLYYAQFYKNNKIYRKLAELAFGE